MSLYRAASYAARCHRSYSSHTASGTTLDKLPSKFGWKYHIDNTIQFMLWASFGSAAIHLLNIKQKYADKERKLSTKIEILKDVITRIGNGEDVDVEKELRVGRTEEEREWQEVLDAFKRQADADTADLPSSGIENTGRETLSSTKADGSRGWFWRT